MGYTILSKESVLKYAFKLIIYDKLHIYKISVTVYGSVSEKQIVLSKTCGIQLFEQLLSVCPPNIERQGISDYNAVDEREKERKKVKL